MDERYKKGCHLLIGGWKQLVEHADGLHVRVIEEEGHRSITTLECMQNERAKPS